MSLVSVGVLLVVLHFVSVGGALETERSSSGDYSTDSAEWDDNDLLFIREQEKI